MPERPEIGVVILAGGGATRLPKKLELEAGGVPMLVRVYRNVSVGRKTYISCAGSFSPHLDALLDCPMVVDRWPGRGPLGGLVSTMEVMETPLVFAVAGDAPFIDSTFIDRLANVWEAGDEAVVPAHPGKTGKRLEPLAALYDRAAFLREGTKALGSSNESLHATVAHMHIREFPVSREDERLFTNVNTPADYAAAIAWMA
ncbi:MAG TPA: molybdenum cofactor guanylyltransferase [Candidatus Baltobacteraceae bacterium]|jgi:molybdopterin-guanine dinucleotide biosynthesis protein A